MNFHLDGADLNVNYSYKLLIPIFAHFIALILGNVQKFTSFEWVDYVVTLVSAVYINSMSESE